MTDYEWELANGLALTEKTNTAFSTSTNFSARNDDLKPPPWAERFLWTRQIKIGRLLIEVSRMEDYPGIRFEFRLI